MASRKKVLGNDPFVRGAAPRRPLANSRPPPPSKKRKAARPDTPELQTPKAPVPAAPRAQVAAPSPGVDPRPWAGAPVAQPLEGPVAHPGSPQLGVDPMPNQASPTAVPLTGALPHPGSPSVAAEAGLREPVPHADAPVEEPLPPKASLEGPSALGALKGLAKAIGAAMGVGGPQTFVDSWGKDRTLTQSLRPLAELLYDKYWRVRVFGAEQVPSGPCILVANHAGAVPVDGPVLHLALRRERPDLVESRWLLEDQVFYAPVLGGLANRLGAVRATPENAHRLLDEGRPVIVFPEGFQGLSKPFAERYQLRRFGRGGYLKIALRAKVPVVPVAVVGAEEAVPLLGRLPGKLFGVDYLPVTLPPLPAKWALRFDAPLSLAGAPDDPEKDLEWVEQKNLEVRDRIQAMLAELLADRGSAF